MAYDRRYALNAICPYYTSFPLEYPMSILKKYKNETILDPFCGRGTTLYASRELGFPAWGIDSSPIAVAISNAKLAIVKPDDVLDLASTLIHKEPICLPDNEFFQVAFSFETLRQICSIREGLINSQTESDASVVLRAAMIGCLHGPQTKTIQTASYFSNHMLRTFSPKPVYSIKYWKSNNLKAPKIDVLKVLAKKLHRIPNNFDVIHPSSVIMGDCTDPKTYQDISKRFSLVITSPPYYGMRTYIQDQWLRNWFLGGPDIVDYKIKRQLNHNGQLAFIQSLASALKNLLLSQSDSLNLYVRFGAIPSVKSCAKQIMLSSIEEATGWKIVSISESNNHHGKRQARQMQCTSKVAPEFDFHFSRA